MPRGVYDRTKSKKRSAKLKAENMVAELRAKKAAPAPVNNALEVSINLPAGETTIKLTSGKRAVGSFVVTTNGVLFLPANAKRTRKQRPTLSWDMLGRLCSIGLLK
jgi:hypothetical protein